MGFEILCIYMGTLRVLGVAVLRQGLECIAREFCISRKVDFIPYYEEFGSKAVPSPRGFGHVLGLSFDSLSLQLKGYGAVLIIPI